jgi:hypothetical protein
MAEEIIVENFDEFEDLVSSKDLNLSDIIINSILNNLENEEGKIHSVDLIIKGEGIVYSLEVLKENFIDTLEKNLKIQEYHEQFERCVEIQQALAKLKN